MPTYEYVLSEPPTATRTRELWLQHAAGFIIFEDARQYAIDKMPDSYSDDQRAAALKAVNDAIYGVMMIIDGVSGGLKNAKHRLSLETKVKLETMDGSSAEELDLADGDGMCMGYHGWTEDDYGRVHPAFRSDVSE